MRFGIWALMLAGILLAQLPEEPGPYRVGCRVRTIQRPSSTDTTTRVMDIYIWYPAAQSGGFWIDNINAYLNALPLPGDTARPVFVFAHGGCGHPLAAVYLTSHIPSWGFVVIATMHPGSMYGEPTCLDSAALHDTWLNRPDDVIFTLNSIVALMQDSSGLCGVPDTTRMGMGGHSFGARTTYAVCNRQDWAKCALPLSGDYTDVLGAPINCMEDVRGVDVPTMLMCGSYDNGLEPEHMMEIFDTLDTPKYAVEIARATHFSFGDTCDTTLDPFCGADSVIPYDLAHNVINHYAVSFLMKYLMGDNRFEDYLCEVYDTLTTVWCETTQAIKSIDNLPAGVNLETCPNPFNQSCRIVLCEHPSGCDYNRDWKSSPTLGIYDVMGQCVDRLEIPRGRSEIIWKPDSNIRSGIYFAVTAGKNFRCIGRMLLVR